MHRVTVIDNCSFVSVESYELDKPDLHSLHFA